MFLSYARFEVLSVVLLKIQVFCDVKLFHLVCTVLEVLATNSEGTMLFKNVKLHKQWHIPEDLNLFSLFFNGCSSVM
jgi:hypothetical protein